MKQWMLTVMVEESWHGHVAVPDLMMAMAVIEMLENLIAKPVHVLLVPWSKTWACTVCPETRTETPEPRS